MDRFMTSLLRHAARSTGLTSARGEQSRCSVADTRSPVPSRISTPRRAICRRGARSGGRGRRRARAPAARDTSRRRRARDMRRIRRRLDDDATDRRPPRTRPHRRWTRQPRALGRRARATATRVPQAAGAIGPRVGGVPSGRAAASPTLPTAPRCGAASPPVARGRGARRGSPPRARPRRVSRSSCDCSRTATSLRCAPASAALSVRSWTGSATCSKAPRSARPTRPPSARPRSRYQRISRCALADAVLPMARSRLSPQASPPQCGQGPMP
jgi:hypothetical protein